MVYLEKSQPAPVCLEKEKLKKDGDYKCEEVLERLSRDFKNKCYICEAKAPTTINVEHFVAHQGNQNLKFDWNNLFFACGHCNNTKLNKFDKLLNCTDLNDDVAGKLKYVFNSFPIEQVSIEALDGSEETKATQTLLLAVYNGITKLKVLESANLRQQLLNEIDEFQKSLMHYLKETNSAKDYEFYLTQIRGHLSRASGFTAFKRWIILENETLRAEFEQHFD